MANGQISAAHKLVVSQGLAAIGAALASFGIDVWFYQRTGSYSSFALIYIAATLPPILVAPFAGYAVDKVSAAKVLFYSQLATVLSLGALCILYVADLLNLPNIAACLFAIATAGEFKYTATSALVPRLVDEGSFNSVNGKQQAFRGIVVIMSPILGAVGYTYLGLTSLLGAAIGLGLYATYVSSSLRAAVPDAVPVARAGLANFLDDYRDGFLWLRGNRQLRLILVHFTVLFGFLSVAKALIVPHVLDSNGQGTLALVVSAQGVGLIVTGIALSRLRRTVSFDSLLFMGCHALGGVIMLFGLSGGLPMLPLSSFLMGVAICLVSAANQSLWQSRTPMHLQGKMTAIRSVSLYLLSPVAIYLSVPLSGLTERAIEDWLPPSLQSGPLQRWTAAVLVLAGASILICSVVAHLLSRRTSIEPSTTIEEADSEPNQVA